ncbi:MAG TPA: hypothetical protein PKW97_11160 [Syntrophorhabdus sp.]|jgi:hypothetical protein|nr:hypothetical protein [Syntrophorhabdus sp.]HQM27058.1 hypothetical protein [Syntrophorhabdus sp.]
MENIENTYINFNKELKESRNLEATKTIAKRYIGGGIEEAFVERPPKESIPETPGLALLCHHLALGKDATAGMDWNKKAEWQRYWLSCLLNPRCDYHFSSLNGIIEREEVLEECYIDEDCLVMWKKIPDGGKAFYRKAISAFYLRRYNWKLAKKASSKLGFFEKLNLAYPRLIGGILLGYIALVCQKEIWQLPHDLWQQLPDTFLSWVYLAAILACVLVLIFLYLIYECLKTLQDRRLAMKRAFNVGLYGLLVSCILALLFCQMMGRTYLSTFVPLEPSTYALNCIFFAPSALLIGILIQVFWEEKTITEPL